MLLLTTLGQQQLDQYVMHASSAASFGFMIQQKWRSALGVRTDQGLEFEFSFKAWGLRAPAWRATE